MMNLLIGETRAAYVGPGLNLQPHTNAVDTVAISLGQPMQIRLLNKGRKWGERHSTEATLIPAGTLHHLVANPESTMVFVYLDPQQARMGNLDKAALEAFREVLRSGNMATISMSEIEKGLGLRTGFPVSSRISRVINQLNMNPEQFESMEEAASLANLSSSRFRALFIKELGLTFRRYRLWRRMAFMIKQVSMGRNLTQACVQAGFSDSSHLSTTFKTMFGISPNFLLDPRVKIHCD